MPGIAEAKGRARRRAQVKRTLIGYTFLTPASAITILFIFVPVFMAFYLSFFEWDLISPPKHLWVCATTPDCLGPRIFFVAMRNTLYFVAVQLPLDFAISLGIALLLNQKKLGGLSFYRTVFFTPVITSTVAVSAVWLWLYDPL